MSQKRLSILKYDRTTSNKKKAYFYYCSSLTYTSGKHGGKWNAEAMCEVKMLNNVRVEVTVKKDETSKRASVSVWEINAIKKAVEKKAEEMEDFRKLNKEEENIPIHVDESDRDEKNKLLEEDSKQGMDIDSELTSPFEPMPELQSEEGVRIYLSKLSRLSRSDICVEFSNVMVAKHNQMMLLSGLNEYHEKQKIVTDLTDKSSAICISVFGQAAVFGYADGDLSSFKELVNNLDNEIAHPDLSPEQHGDLLLKSLGEHLQ